MKINSTIYWASTVIFSLMMTYSAYAYLTQPVMAHAFQHLGFPVYFHIELAIAKLLGVAPLQARLKEWAYAGFAFTLISAFVGHSAVGDPIANRVMPLTLMALWAASYVAYHRLHQEATD
jgi:hypothetical protein